RGEVGTISRAVGNISARVPGSTLLKSGAEKPGGVVKLVMLRFSVTVGRSDMLRFSVTLVPLGVTDFRNVGVTVFRNGVLRISLTGFCFLRRRRTVSLNGVPSHFMKSRVGSSRM